MCADRARVRHRSLATTAGKQSCSGRKPAPVAYRFPYMVIAYRSSVSTSSTSTPATVRSRRGLFKTL